MEITQLSSAQLKELLAQKEETERLERQAKIQAYENLKEASIQKLFDAARKVSEMLALFKQECYEEIDTLEKLLPDYEGDTDVAQRKEMDSEGSATAGRTLYDATGNLKIKVSHQNFGEFDERSVLAENLLRDFIKDAFSEDSSTRKLIENLLNRNNGKIDPRIVQKLYKMESEFADPRFGKAMELFRESYRIVQCKSYVNFYERETRKDAWKNIKLSFTSV